MSRLFMSVIAAVFVAIIAFSPDVVAQSNNQSTVNDIAVLQYALTLENLEATFYAQGQVNFSRQAFVNAGFNPSIWDFLNVVAAHEAAHVQFLTTALGSSAVPACTYNFASVNSVASYLATARALENTGVMAYDGAISGITNSAYQTAAATIVTIEARHATYLNQYFNSTTTGGVGNVTYSQPFVSAAFDTGLNVTQIYGIAGGFLYGCPYTLPQPTVRPGGVGLNSQNQVVATGPVIGTGTPTYTSAQAQNDINALNFALTLENLESAFYNLYQAQFTSAQFQQAGLTAADYAYFGIIAAHENAHVAALSATISGRGSTPVAACSSYNFGTVSTVQQYVALARTLENTGVTAYDGAVDAFTDTGLQVIAAEIATIEARHAAYLNQLFGAAIAAPYPYDNATSPSAIFAAVASFFPLSCTQALNLPLPVVASAAVSTSSSSAVPSSSAAAAASTGASVVSPAANDIAVLQYALTLENLEAGFYSRFQQQFTRNNFVNAGYSGAIWDYLNVVAAHESAHVQFLNNVLGSAAVPACTYNFAPVVDVASYLANAKALEATGVMAYDGAISSISNPAYQQAAATIVTVEARHATFINQYYLTNPPISQPFTSAIIDTGLNVSAIYAIAGGFISSCPYALPFPTIRPGGVALNSQNQVVATGPVITAGNPVYTVAQQTNDITGLNYALTLENLESAFYNQYQARFSSNDFVNAGLTTADYMYFQIIQTHEQSHVNALATTIASRGGTAVTACSSYNFGTITTVQQYVAMARTLENTGVMAYDGAVNVFTDTGIQVIAAEIATIEARHAAYLNQLYGAANVTANSFDTAASPSFIFNQVATFFPSSCTQALNLKLPSVASAGTVSSSTGMQTTNAAPPNVHISALIIMIVSLITTLALQLL